MSPYAPKTSPRPPPRPDDLGKSKPPNTTSGDSANEGGGRVPSPTDTINDYAQVGLGAAQDTIENRSILDAARDAGRILDGGDAMLNAAEDGDIDFYDLGKVGGAVRGGIPGSTVSAVAEIAEAVDDGYKVGITGGILGGIAGGVIGGAGGTALSPGAGNAAGTVAGVAIGESLGREAEIALVGGIARERQRNAERLEDNPAREFTVDGVSQAIDDWENSIRSRLGLPFQPLIVDLDRDGPEIMSQDGSSAFFDMDGDGFIEQTAWVGPGDGFLTIDLSTSGAKKPDGRITHAREFAFANFTSAKDTDLQAFRAKYDSNKDGRFNKSDSAWSLARIWRDKDLDGVSDPGEVRSLSSYGISEVRLAHRGASMSDRSNDVRFEGSTVHGTGDIVRNGKTQAHGFADVTLAKTSAGMRTQDIGNGLLTEFEGPKGPKILRMEGNGSSSVDMRTSDLDFVLGDHRHNILKASGATSAVIMNGEGGNDKLYGSKYSDVLNGGAGSNKLYGNAGNDIIFFQQGDYVRGGSGYDTGVLITTVTFEVDLVELQLEGLNGAHGNDLVRASNSKHGYVIFGGGGQRRRLVEQGTRLRRRGFRERSRQNQRRKR